MGGLRPLCHQPALRSSGRHHRAFRLAILHSSGLRQRAVECLTLRRGDCVLDVGCGSGRNFPFLRKAIGSTGRIYGVDLSARMLRKARELGDRHHWTNIHLTEDDAVNYVAPEPLDGVLFSFSRAAASLSSTPSFRAALEERSFCLSVCG